jgi:hypothetical protein
MTETLAEKTCTTLGKRLVVKALADNRAAAIC